MKCEISDCDKQATGWATFCHPDPSVRWSAALCDEHKLEAFNKAGGKGEIVLGPLPVTELESRP